MTARQTLLTPRSPRYHLRRRRFRTFARLVESLRERRNGPVSVIDLGGTLKYWRLVPDLLDLSSIDLVVANITPKPDIHDELASGLAFRSIRYLQVDGTGTGLPDGAFDIAHSNSVIEHVGTWRNMRLMAQEIRRLGSGYFVQVPNFWFPLEPHFRSMFFHWAPEQMRARRLMRRSHAHFPQARTMDEAMAMIEGVRLLDRTQLAALFPDARIVTERVVLAKSYIAVREPDPGG